MSIELWLAFAITSSVLLVVPGPTILTVVSYALKHGSRATVRLVLAVALGDATAVTLSLLGLGAVLVSSSFLFGLVKSLGGLYLLYLGLKFLLQKPSVSDDSEVLEESDAIFFNTFIVTALNPKGIIFFIAFLPQFINQELAVTPQLVILATTFVALGAINATIYAMVANRASNHFRSKKVQRRIEIAGGSLLTLAGLWTLTSQRA